MTTSTMFPPGFTRGAPSNKGTYVLLCEDCIGYSLVVREIQDVQDAQAAAIGVRPGLCAFEDLETCELVELDTLGVVGHMELEGVSAVDLWFHDGPIEGDDLQLTDQVIDRYLDNLRKRLKTLVFKNGVIDLDLLPHGLRIGVNDVVPVSSIKEATEEK